MLKRKLRSETTPSTRQLRVDKRVTFQLETPPTKRRKIVLRHKQSTTSILITKRPVFIPEIEMVLDKTELKPLAIDDVVSHTPTLEPPLPATKQPPPSSPFAEALTLEDEHVNMSMNLLRLYRQSPLAEHFGRYMAPVQEILQTVYRGGSRFHSFFIESADTDWIASQTISQMLFAAHWRGRNDVAEPSIKLVCPTRGCTDRWFESWSRLVASDDKDTKGLVSQKRLQCPYSWKEKHVQYWSPIKSFTAPSQSRFIIFTGCELMNEHDDLCAKMVAQQLVAPMLDKNAPHSVLVFIGTDEPNFSQEMRTQMGMVHRDLSKERWLPSPT